MGGAVAAIAIAIFETGAVSFGTAIAISSALANLAVSLTLSFVSGKLLAKKPPTTNLVSQGRTITVREPVQARPVIYGETRVGGTIVFLASSGADNKYLHLAIALAGHECEAIGTVYFDDYALPLTASGAGFNSTTGRFASRVYVEKHLGADDQTASAAMVSAGVGWTTDHRLRGIAYLYVRLEWDRDKFPTGVPNISAIVKGRKVYDPRTETTAYSANGALCLRDYLTDSTYGLGAATAEIDDTLLAAAANVCDENVTLAAGGTEDRYTCNGVISSDQTPADVIPALLSSMAGRAIWSGGEWRVFAGAYLTPTVTLDEDDLRAGFRTVNRVSRRDLFNRVKGVFVGPANDYQPADFPPVTNATYLSQDNGEPVWKDVDLPFTATASAAQRLAKIDLERMRQQITIPTLPCNLTAFKVRAGDVIGITNSRKGWDDKPFEVTDWRLVVEDDADGAPLIGVDLSLRETASTVYDWASGEETEVDPAPDSSLPDPWTVAIPGAPAITESLYTTRDGAGVKAKATLDWVAADDQFVTVYQPEYKLSSAATWIALARTADTTAEVLDIAPGVYDFRVKAVNELGVSSAYSTVTNRDIQGLAAPPSALTGLTISTIGGLAILRWTQSPDLDVRIGGKIVFRHSQAQTGATWQTSVSIGEAVAGSEAVAVLPLKAGTYLARAVDSLGIQGAVSTASTKQATALAYTQTDTLSEHDEFPGALDGTVVIDGLLKLAGADAIDDWPAVDDVADWDSEGGIRSAGTYTFDGSFDFGAEAARRLTTAIAATVVNALDLIDSRTDPIDGWEDVDGNAAGSADCQVWMRHTDDDPEADPTWSDWQRLDSGEASARAVQFQARLSSADPAYNIHVAELTATADRVT